MESEKTEILWGLFVEFWDDEVVTGGRGDVFINARTVGVFQRVFGATVVLDSLRRWETEGSVKVLGTPATLDPDARCVQVMDYVSNIPPGKAGAPPQDSGGNTRREGVD